MRRLAVSDNELLQLFEMCLEAEDRCEQRCHELREKGNDAEAAYQSRLRDRYAYLKVRLFAAMKNPEPSTLEQILEMLRGVGDGMPVTESSRI
jgi:hypothetical protein